MKMPRVIPKLMTSQTGKQLQYTYCPICTGNQTMEFEQLIEY